MKKYKIVFTDIDDTLNPSNSEVSTYTKTVMHQLQEKQIYTVINSGRDISYAIKKSKEANMSPYVIGSNGAEIYNYETNEVIYNASINPETIKKIYKYCQTLDITIYLNSNTKRFCSQNIKDTIYIYDINKILKENPIQQIVITSYNYERMLILPALFEEKYKDISINHSSIMLKEKRPKKDALYYHDIVKKNISKSTGIVELLDYLKLKEEDALAIGNGYDDECMMDVVGFSVAVENAVEQLKKRVDYITSTSADDGVAKCLEKIILKSGE